MTTVLNKNGIEFDIDAIATDLNGKADIDLSNISSNADVADKSLSNINNSAKVLTSSMGMPSTTKVVNLTLGSSGASYTAPADGYVVIQKGTNANNQYVSMNAANIATESKAPTSGSNISLFAPVKKGATFSIWYSAGGTTNIFRFVYAVGSESTAS